MQHHQGGAGYPYGPPLTATATVPLSAATVSVSSAPCQSPSPMPPQPTGTNFEELAAAVSTGGGAVNFHGEDDMPAVDVGCERGGSEAGAGAGGSGSRWPREETLALIRIRSEMDAAFRNAAVKSLLWEEVCRKLAELGYSRSAKKCKEKFENVDKYYKRTKEGRAGRQDGKSYRFFSELEALHAAAAAPQQNQATSTTVMTTAACTTAVPRDPQQLAVASQMAPTVLAHPGPGAGLLPDLSFSSDSGSDSDDESEEEEDDDQPGGGQEGSGKLTTGGGDFDGRDRTVMALFERMVKRIMEKQEASQRLFLDTLEKWEGDRTAREEAWRRQELARMNREREQHARERAASAARDAALVAFLQRFGGNSPMPVQTAAHGLDASATSLQLVVAPPLKAEESSRFGVAGRESSGGLSRWPKEEVEALIQLRMEKDEHYQGMATGAKGPLWEDIAAGMQRIGYNRSSKRCKEKWENINKYFKKVKESRKRRPEDSKTCPYFHQLDAIYRKKQFIVRGCGGGGGSSTATGNTTATITASEQENAWRELQGKMSNDSDKRDIVEGCLHAPPPGNGEPSAATPVLDAIATNKKAEENMTMATEANMQSRQKELTTPDETDSDDIEGNYTDEGDDDSNEDGKVKYMIEFQKSKDSGSSNTPDTATAETVVASSAPTSSTFLAVQ
uniref:Uncharacterized protein n=2 Tax=Avena sativa TaxID=4498 RepID=A0ACD5Z1T8_AVESA